MATKSENNKFKKGLKNALSTMGAWAGALGIVFGPLLAFYGVLCIIGYISNQNKTNEPPVEQVVYEKSAEQKRYEQECIDVNVAWQEDPDLEFKIDKNSITTYCGCMGNLLFPEESKIAIFPEDNMDLDKKCRISTFSKEDEEWSKHGYADWSAYGKLSLDFGDKEFILDYIKWYNWRSMENFWYVYGYNVSFDNSCVLNNIYDEKNPPYYVETVFMNGKIKSAMRACSDDPRIEEFLTNF